MPPTPLAIAARLRFAATMKRIAPLCLLLAWPGVAGARDSLGVFERWGAFRDAEVPRCYAITQPVRKAEGQWRPFLTVANWPAKGVRGQIHVRLSRPRAMGSGVTLSVGDRRFALVAGSADAWAADKRDDAAIIAAIRSGTSLIVESRDSAGHAFVDAYSLRGGATAIDAAALGCARLR